jgi:hypothetical protein
MLPAPEKQASYAFRRAGSDIAKQALREAASGHVAPVPFAMRVTRQNFLGNIDGLLRVHLA